MPHLIIHSPDGHEHEVSAPSLCTPPVLDFVCFSDFLLLQLHLLCVKKGLLVLAMDRHGCSSSLPTGMRMVVETKLREDGALANLSSLLDCYHACLQFP